ncbi:MAG: 4Fe-4S binding protein [Nitrospirota bacterium]
MVTMSFTHFEIKTYVKEVPHIEFNMGACLGALECGKCLQACAPHVMRCYTPIPEGKTSTSKEWIPVATFPSLCTGCMKCVEVCPKKDEKAISVTFKPMKLPKKIFNRR